MVYGDSPLDSYNVRLNLSIFFSVEAIEVFNFSCPYIHSESDAVRPN